MDCKVSVIIPTYNYEKYIDKCVSSVVEQTLRDIEIILVDDGSTDDTPKICDKWTEKDSRIKVIHKKNGGAASARNAGIAVASGKYVCFFDSDDTISDNMLESLWKKLNETGADICTCLSSLNGETLGSYKEETKEFNVINLGAAIPELMNENLVPYSPCNSMYRLDIIKKYNILFADYSKVFSEDALFNLMYFCVTQKRAYINEPMYHIFRHENSLMTSSIPGDYIVRHTNLMIELEEFIKKNNLKIKTGTETACMYWDWVRIACARSKGNTEIVEADFKNASTKKYFKRKIFSFAFGFAAFKYRKYYPMSIGGFVNLKRTAIHLYFKKFNQAIKEYFL
ncbi:MAG: glycosyltransferase [Clostridia bacterium]|nr:glycosyltransferase [Clostridia bacterium]